MLQLSFNTKLNHKDLNSYDIADLEVAVTIASEAAFVVENLTFHLILQEFDAASYEDEADIEVYADALMLPNNDMHGQQTHINQQISKLPFTVLGEQTMVFSVPTFALNARQQNFLDILKSVPEHLLKKQPKLELFIKCIINKDSETEKTKYEIFTIPNPFCPISDNFRKWRLD